MPTPALLAEDYRRAEHLLGHHRSRLVLGAVVPQWLDEHRFRYTTQTADGPRTVVVDPRAGTREPAAEPPRADEAGQPPGGAPESRSPDGRWAVFRRDHDLWLRPVAGGGERRLTDDGTRDRPWAANPDSAGFRITLRNLGLAGLPPAVVWSPDSRRLVTHRLDQSAVLPLHLVESTPPDGGRPVLHTSRFAMPGDRELPRAGLVVLDIGRGTRLAPEEATVLVPHMSPVFQRKIWWDGDGLSVYWLDQSRDYRTLRLKRLDTVTGAVRTLVEESSATRTEPAQEYLQEPMVRVIDRGRKVLWYSQRDDWGHLYLYDAASGRLERRLTAGEWAVQRIVRVHESAGTVHFLASGLVGGDPCLRQLCRVGLDGTGFARVTDDERDHEVFPAPSGAYFVDSASTPEHPPVSTVRDWDGSVLMELETADDSRLVAAGRQPPERFCVKAADGVTDIHGLLYRPHGFDPAGRYPVVDHPYPGPQTRRVRPTFDPGPYGYDAEAVAALGFAVVALDGRGTPGRSKSFHDLSYGRLGDAGCLDDHVAALRQLAGTRPWLDLDRVGLFGRSGGGFATVRALLAHPEVFKVGVAECGNHNQGLYQALWGEAYQGPYDERTYAEADNGELADRLTGKLLLVHGELDDNVTPHLTMGLVSRLIAANADFDLLIVPGAEHGFHGYEPYVIRRRWDYLVRNLMGAEPPAGYRLADIPGDPESFLAMFG
ncbi:DPP IV N-terminal domain-containing protein [Streptomyces sp. NPDC051018]|uniref:S9 family peptidase n=1 Tax=Streptomyces sp. NPDC051018 TaxID=3365639 RepID=UPI00378E2306